MLHELREPIPVTTPLGRGYAIFVEQGAHDTFWTVVLSEGGGFVTFSQDRIRAADSYTQRRGIDDAAMRAIVAPAK
jgi:hypothetical protein